jgi:hypothetical protein
MKDTRSAYGDPGSPVSRTIPDISLIAGGPSGRLSGPREFTEFVKPEEPLIMIT